jgi:PTS system cellobiose-specific IIC component
MDKLSEFLGPIAAALNANKYLCAIKDAFASIVSLIIVGSIGTLIGSVICSSTNGLAQFAGFEWLADLAPIFTTVNSATTNMIAILVAYYIGRNLAKSNGLEGTTEGLISICALICAAPTTVTAFFGEESKTVAGLSTDVTAAKGLFVAMLVGMISIEIYCRLTKVDAIKIRMPDSVPSNVAASFSALIPTAIVLFGVSLVSFIFRKGTGMYLSEGIYKLLAVPVNAAFQKPIGIILCAFIAAVFWICGLHGASIVTGVTDAITIAAVQTNAELVMAGQAPTQIVTRPFWSMYITMGGFGCTIGLIIAIFLVSKREDFRAIAKLSIAPGFFGINEPVIFGLPIVMNPILGIPFILAPMVSASIGYFMTAIGFAGKAYIMVPWCMPPVINGLLATGGNIGAAITQIICIIVCTLIYLPFVKICNNQSVSEE